MERSEAHLFECPWNLHQIESCAQWFGTKKYFGYADLAVLILNLLEIGNIFVSTCSVSDVKVICNNLNLSYSIMLRILIKLIHVLNDLEWKHILGMQKLLFWFWTCKKLEIFSSPHFQFLIAKVRWRVLKLIYSNALGIHIK